MMTRVLCFIFFFQYTSASFGAQVSCKALLDSLNLDQSHINIQEQVWEQIENKNQNDINRLSRILAETLRQPDQAVSVEEIKTERSKEYFILTFSNGIKAIFKPEDLNSDDIIDGEVIAYKIDNLLGLNVVPYTQFATFKGTFGSIQVLINDARVPTSLPKDQSKKIRFLDWFIRNYDRYIEIGHNVLITRSNRPVAIDHSRAFWNDNPRGALPTRIESINDPELKDYLPSEHVLNKLKNISEDDWVKLFSSMYIDRTPYAPSSYQKWVKDIIISQQNLIIQAARSLD